MKKILLITSFTLLIIASCKDSFLETKPQGVVVETILATEQGLDGLLIGAYSLLDGVGSGPAWSAPGTNWLYGSATSDDAYYGEEHSLIDPTNIEMFFMLPSNSYFREKWQTVYDGVSRSNDVIRLAEEVPDMSTIKKQNIIAEARFLRGHYHFDAKKMWNNVPYIDEAVTDFQVANDKNIWPMIEADFQFAIDNLPEEQPEPGRATKWAAKAYLAKAHLFQQDFAAAKPLLDDIIDNGPFQLVACFHDNFRAATNNNEESIFEVQMSVNDGAPNGENGNFGDVLNFPYTGGPGVCCGVHQPSHNLVNAFKTDDNGLPLIETFNELNVKNDQGLEGTDPFTPYPGNLDPRLDWSVGRRSIPYLDWGPFPGKPWIRSQQFGGPYVAIKNVYYKEEEGINSTASGWTKGLVSNNYRMIRLSHVILWRAEVAVEEGDLDLARQLINRLRLRAKDGCIVTNPDGTPAATYVIDEYPAGSYPFDNKENARKAVHFETRLETAMEGHRFFDLVRWGIAAEVINKYLEAEKTRMSYLQGVKFEKGKHEYFPIPQNEIDIIGADKLKQNPGY